MDENRRKFLKLAGLAALGIPAGKYVKVFANELPAKVPYVRVSSKKRLAMVINLKTMWDFDVLIVALDIPLQERIMNLLPERNFDYWGISPILLKQI